MAKHRLVSGAICACLLMMLVGCSNSLSYAPVVELTGQKGVPKGYYRVKKGDTLYSIAWLYAKDYRLIAQVNQLKAPYTIKPGQLIRTSHVIVSRSHGQASKKLRMAYLSQQQEKSVPTNHWLWPVRGKVISNFLPNAPGGNRGVDITGYYGEPIRAVAAGKVVYSGAGVRGYGNLIIIKHSASYLSAYAFNKVNLVRRGMWVKSGQLIAQMGRNDAGQTLLHFELRQNGQPVNPLHFLR